MSSQSVASGLEQILCSKLGLKDLPHLSRLDRQRHLGAFWQHWALNRRICNFSGANIISPYADDCPYPVWKNAEWNAHSNPPSAKYEKDLLFFQQAWQLFQLCPIPHNTAGHNENCEYTDDCWYSQNCYLSHNIINSKDLKYCYRTYNIKNCHYAAMSFDSELSVDLVNSRNCFEAKFVINSRQCRDSAFLYDCRNCSNCLFCYNLRNKEYCLGNKQLTRQQFLEQSADWDLRSRIVYNKAKQYFSNLLAQNAFHRALFIDNCESAHGNYLENCKNVQDCFFAHNLHDCVNCIRGEGISDSMDCMAFDNGIELAYQCVILQDFCYGVSFCYNLTACRFLDYCFFCAQCEHCFGCCGLVGKKYHILNREYSKEQYFQLKSEIIDRMQSSGEYGNFFPAYFSPTAYDASWSGYHFPLDLTEQKRLGFRVATFSSKSSEKYSNPSEIPLLSNEAGFDLADKNFWDAKLRKPFRIQAEDIKFYQERGVALPERHYIARLQENFSWLPFNGDLRTISCKSCKASVLSSLPSGFEAGALCDDCYFFKL